jgi:RimJ/RimL family protein N-acetyltransferase
MLCELARRLPDVPEWVELRGMLLSGRCELVGPPGPGPTDFLVRGTDFGLFCLSGAPSVSELARELDRHRGRAALCAASAADRVAAALPGWKRSRALLSTLPESASVPERPRSGARIGMLSPDAAGALEHVPAVLREEVQTALGFAHVAAAFVGERPVAFCYAGYETEKFWDVSIDTLEEHRGRGYARECCEHMLGHMARHGKDPVWGALEGNTASRRLAASLGFSPAGELAIFEPPGAV